MASPTSPSVIGSPIDPVAAAAVPIPSSDSESDIDIDSELRLPPGLGLSAAEPSPRIPIIPIPTVSPGGEAVSFRHPNNDDDDEILSRPLPEDLVGADFVIAADGSYVETSSGPFARELKKRYDTLYGVNLTVRTPYATTTFVGQHGQTRFRVGHRDMSAPGASAVGKGIDDIPSNYVPPPSSYSRSSNSTSPAHSSQRSSKAKMRSKSSSGVRSVSGSGSGSNNNINSNQSNTDSEPSSSTSPRNSVSQHFQSQSYSRGKRHSKGRISINALLGTQSQTLGTNATTPASVGLGMGAGGGGGSRKLRKPRSNPDLSSTSEFGHGHTFGFGQKGKAAPPPSSGGSGSTGMGGSSGGGRMHSLSVTATDMPHVVGIDPNDPTSLGIGGRSKQEKKGDAFGDVMGWSVHKTNPHNNLMANANLSTASAPSTSYEHGLSGNGFFEPGSDSGAGTAATDELFGFSGFDAPGNATPLGSFAGPSGISGFVPRPFGPRVHFDIPTVVHNHPHTHLHRSRSSSSASKGKHPPFPIYTSFSSSSSSDEDDEDKDGYYLGLNGNRNTDPDSDYDRFLKTGGGTTRILREMQSFESGLTITGVTGLTGAGQTGAGPATILEVDLGRDINLGNLGEVDFGEIVDLALSGYEQGNNAGAGVKGKERVVERQRSAIRLTERDTREREREKTVTVQTVLEDGVGGSNSSTTPEPSLARDTKIPSESSASGSGSSSNTLSALASSSTLSSSPSPGLNSEPAPEPEHPLHIHPVPDTSDIDSILQRPYSVGSFAGLSPSSSPTTEELFFVPTTSSSTSQTRSPGTPRAPHVPRVQIYLPPGLPPRLAKFATYSTDIFDVLQTSRGLPLLDLLDDDGDMVEGRSGDRADPSSLSPPSSNSKSKSPKPFLPETAPVKLSLSQDNSAAPKDDPRFVIWGEVKGLNHNGSIASHETSSSVSRTSMKGKRRESNTAGDGTPTGVGGGGGSAVSIGHNGEFSDDDGSPKQRVLLAATIERWLAQLTSDLDYDELLNFFLTYRTYVSALDLARLLMARFCWALGSSSGAGIAAAAGTGGGGEDPGSPPTTSSTATVTPSHPVTSAADVNHDDVVRRIVRVRTFVAFKYWLITFFTVDFVPNRELRLFVASHLNDLGKELGQLGKEVESAVQAEVEKEKRTGTEISAKETREMKEMKEREMGMSRGAIMDGVSIVKKLKKVAKDCKTLYTHNNPTTMHTQSSSSFSAAHSLLPSSRKSISLSRSGESDSNASSNNTKRGEHLFGAKFAEATRKLSAASAASAPDADDSDVDLDFISDGDPRSPSSMMPPFSGVGVRAYGSAVNFGGASMLNLSSTISPPGPGSIPLSSFSILQRTDHAPGPEGFYNASANVNSQIPHNPLSRVLVKTLGRLGRWKRVLNSGGVAHGVNMQRSMTMGGMSGNGGKLSSHSVGGLTRMAAACADVSAFDVELTVDSSDFSSSSRGVESYLRLLESQNQQVTTPRKHIQQAPPGASVSSPNVSSSLPATEPAQLPPIADVTNSSEPVETKQPAAESPVEHSRPPTFASEPRASISSEATASDISSSEPDGDVNRISVADTISTDQGVVTNVYEVRNSSTTGQPASSHRESRSTFDSNRTSSTDSFGEPLSASRASARFPEFTSPWQFDVVSLDELSDNSSDERGNTAHGRGGPGAPPGLRRPPRRLPHRRDFEFLERPETVSSMGIISRSSIISAGSASGQSTASRASSSSAVGGLGGGIQQWQMNALKDSLSDDEETGDVDEALKRLEGQINPQKQQEKVSKVNGWVRTIRERLAAGDYSDEEPMYSDGDDDEEEGRAADDERENMVGPEDSLSPIDAVSATIPASSAEIPLPDVDSGAIKTPQPDQVASPTRSVDAKPAVEDVVPLEILQSRLISEVPPATPERVHSMTSKFVDPSNGPKAHRSFILQFKTEELAQHFAMIDRELFMTIKFEELLLEDWMYTEEVNALDWAQFLKDRARWKAESRWPEKTSALGAVRARFNLMVNFVISEIVLTNQAERPFVFARFLRIAWKSYQRRSFNTLVAIVTGLQSDWVSRVMRKSMHKLAVWDSRMLADFKVFTSSEDNFKHIRATVDAINDAKPFDTTSRAPSAASATDKNATPPSCVPFIGAYLSQLYQYSQLPVLIDPTAPNEVVTFDPVSSNLSPPAHPEVFSTLAPLPSSMHLEPLINVHRQRLIAGVVKSLVAGQHLASRVQFPIDKKLFHKCLRIRGLDSNTLQTALAMLPN